MRSRGSGTIEGEMIVEACKMFQAVEHKEFMLLPCWRELRHHPKWQSESSRKKQKTSGAASPASLASTQNVQSSPREIFDRQFSLKERIEKDRAERFTEMMNIERQQLRLEEERMQLEKVKEEMVIINMDLSQMDDEQKEYYKSLR
ncbi:glutathione S-transferase T2-like [Phragmites australis]|uniref:glutathione S-transferase T2-like n=1 Tax=Phragmites australis TaxID=29695 RepID=UPI002D78FC4A|nr:glutathione S-transferase T2-like [Phragmites australis]